MHAREENLLRSMTQTTWRFYAWVGLLGAVLLWGLTAYLHQLRSGLVVTGMRDQISWGLYITDFVFFIGISHAGTLISAILRVTDTGWRTPITRMAEAVTVFALCIGAPMVIVDMGRPDRMLNLFRYGRIQSPIVWDVLGVSTYLTGCILYFYIPMIPDLALLAERPELSSWRRAIYRRLSLGWRGTHTQKELLERAISAMAVFIIPLAVSVHTVVSWIFAMTLRPGWDSSIFGPYFVVGAIYSGAAAVIFSMYILRRVYHLHDYIEPLHFRKLGLMLLAFSMLYLYFNINEYLTAGYKLQGSERTLLDRLFVGDYAFTFWSAQAICVFIPLALMLMVLGFKRYEQFTIPGIVTASAMVIVGAWMKRYIIVVPTLRSPFLPSGQRLPWEWTHYNPTWVEWSITAAAVAGFLMIYTLLSKMFPIVSIWETREGGVAEVAVAPAAAPSRWWKAGAMPTGFVLAVILVGSVAAHAATPKKAPKATLISLEWKALPPVKATVAEEEDERAMPKTAASVSEPSRVYWYAGRIFNPLTSVVDSRSRQEEDAVVTPIQIAATLRDAGGTPIAFKPVDFTVETGFGALPLGNRPTMGDGTAQLVVRDRRYGSYPVRVHFAGDDEYAEVSYVVPVIFGERPNPALPHIGMLITPYATAGIALPFFLFYGAMWVAFFYAFGYLIVVRMRKCGDYPPTP